MYNDTIIHTQAPFYKAMHLNCTKYSKYIKRNKMPSSRRIAKCSFFHFYTICLHICCNHSLIKLGVLTFIQNFTTNISQVTSQSLNFPFKSLCNSPPRIYTTIQLNNPLLLTFPITISTVGEVDSPYSSVLPG